MREGGAALLADAVDANTNFLLTTHVRADPDGVAAEFALYHALTRRGKNVLIINDSDFPESLGFLFNSTAGGVSGQDKSVDRPASPFVPPKYFMEPSGYDAQKDIRFDVVISLDTPNLKRLGRTADLIPPGVTLINVDHHISNEQFGSINWVLPDASSTGEMVYQYLKETGQELTLEMAKALYTSILTDTGRFVHANTSPVCLRIASDLLELGVDPAEVSNAIYNTNSYEILRLQSLAIESMKLEVDGKIAVIWLTNDMIGRSGVGEHMDTQVLVDIPSSISGVQVGILLKELKETGEIKVSLRSKYNTDVNAIAQRFGGGGHLKASGCEIIGSIEDVHATIVEAVRQSL